MRPRPSVENYRFAHAVQLRSQSHQASTEDLREAMLRYRSLFDELLRPTGGDAEAAAAEQAQPVSPNGRHRMTAAPEDRVPEARLTRQADGPAAEEDNTLADPAASQTGYRDERDTDYRDEQIGR